MTNNRLYLQHILEHLTRIEVYTQGGKAEFLQSSLIQDGVIRCFEIVGEAVKLLSPELKQNYPEITWKRIAGFRDILIHNYAGVDLDEVWNVVEYNVPDLKSKIVQILSEIGNEIS